jgi:hypothetical protein
MIPTQSCLHSHLHAYSHTHQPHHFRIHVCSFHYSSLYYNLSQSIINIIWTQFICHFFKCRYFFVHIYCFDVSLLTFYCQHFASFPKKKLLMFSLFILLI